jgi:hypothetical protein
MLTVYIAQHNLEAKLEQFRAAQAEAEAAIPRIVAKVRQRKGGLHAWAIGRQLRCPRELGVGQPTITRTDTWFEGGIVWYRNQIIKRRFK